MAAGMIRGACDPRPDGHARYARGTQLAEAVAFLQSHRQRIAFVTIDIGGNDARNCIEQAVVRIAWRYPRERPPHCGRAAPRPDWPRDRGHELLLAIPGVVATGAAGRRIAVQLTDSVAVPFNAGLEAAYASAESRGGCRRRILANRLHAGAGGCGSASAAQHAARLPVDLDVHRRRPASERRGFGVIARRSPPC
jgi:hypothetical protein